MTNESNNPITLNNMEINPFDITSGKVVQTHLGTYWFKEPGNNMHDSGCPMWGNLHRDNDLPAIILSDGSQYWYKDGKPHRDNDLPAVVEADGSQGWWVNGEKHRDNGPAVICSDGSKYWYKSGRRCWEDGLPSVFNSDGSLERLRQFAAMINKDSI